MKPWLPLLEKPWLPNGDDHRSAPPQEVSKFRAKDIGLRFFLAVVSVFFLLFLLTFLARSQYPDFVALADNVWQPFYQTRRLWLNTTFLLLASIGLQAALVFCRRQQLRHTQLALIATLFFSLQFLIAQLWLWRHLYELGFYLSANPANSYFYVLTALHGLHLAGGMVVLLSITLRAWRLNLSTYPLESQALQNSLTLCTRYWHYLLAVWLVIFFFSASSPGTYKTLAALCGYPVT